MFISFYLSQQVIKSSRESHCKLSIFISFRRIIECSGERNRKSVKYCLHDFTRKLSHFLAKSIPNCTQIFSLPNEMLNSSDYSSQNQ